jgi:adenine-specific DNA-methyltransferase
MKKIDLNDPISKSADILAGNADKLKAIFPEAITEGKIDFEVLRQLLGGMLDEKEEKYGLNWHGKRRARQLALTPSTGTLRPCPEDSTNWETSQNLMIEGDNLEALKLIQKAYSGKVKIIYIDPPYNTGNDFVYPDDFQDSLRNYEILMGWRDKDGSKTSSLTGLKNNESSGRFHTDWLNMIYPRLKTAQWLLKRDGAIFVSCDEAEQPRLRMIMDEIFGQANFVTDIVWAAGRKNDSRLVSVSHEYIVCYARDLEYLTSQKIEWRQRKKGLDDIYAQYEKLKRKHGSDYSSMTADMKDWFKGLADNNPTKAHKHYSHVDDRGVYFPDNISWPGGGGPTYEVLHPRTKRPVAVPSRGWMTSDPNKMKQWIAEDLVHFGADESSVPCIKSYLKDREYQAPYSVMYQDGRAASKRLRALMGDDCFDFPKDETVLQELIGMMSSGDDLILDYFAGSGTTGHAVMAQNAADGGNRRYVLVQLPEPLDPENKDQKVAADFCDKLKKPRTIAELTKERLRRAAKKVQEENPSYKGDLGFRVFKLASSNIRDWDPDSAKLAQSLDESVDHIKSDRTEQDIFYELLLKLGLDLCVPIESKAIKGGGKKSHAVHVVGAGALIVCLSTSISKEDVEPLALGIVAWHKALKPSGDTDVVFRDSAFADDVVKTNLTAILRQNGLEKVSSL